MEPLFLNPVDDPILRLTSNGYSKPFVNITDIDEFNINVPSRSSTVPRENIRQDKGLDESEKCLLLSDINDSENSIQKEPSLVKNVVLEDGKGPQLTDSEDPTPIVLVQELKIEPDDDLENVQKITDSTETIEEAECSEYLPINKENGLKIIDSRSLVQEECDINEYLLKNQRS